MWTVGETASGECCINQDDRPVFVVRSLAGESQMLANQIAYMMNQRDRQIVKCTHCGKEMPQSHTWGGECMRCVAR